MNARRLPSALLGTALALLVVPGACASSPTPTAAPTTTRQTQEATAPAPPAAEAPRTTPEASVARAQPEAPAVQMLPPPDCNRKLQSLVDEAPPTSIVTVPACVYRETVTLNKPIALIAQP